MSRALFPASLYAQVRCKRKIDSFKQAQMEAEGNRFHLGYCIFMSLMV